MKFARKFSFDAWILVVALCLPFASASALAQNGSYVGDGVFIVLHAGPGANYRWLGKLTPGTALTELQQPDGSDWTEVRTQRGTVGWVQTEFLTSEPPAQTRLPLIQRQLEEAEREAAAARANATKFNGERDELRGELARQKEALQQITEELAQLRQISGSAIETAEQNRRLVEESATLQMNLDTLEADNQRLQERVRSGAFLDGAFAVALGVFIALVVPRLWPKRRSSSSWA
ncbi:MAG: TIGR04211 family SH3 domain-containing protein [Pseudomonadota bacterium]